MNRKFSLLILFLAGASALAQTTANTPGASSSGPANAPSTGSRPGVSVSPDLDRLQAAASQVSVEIRHLRIDKWKADADTKRQAQANADSLQRNLTAALPGLIDAARSTPQDLSAEFKLYRNLNALYDVFVSLTEATGAFGPRSDYEALGQQLETIDSVRRNLGNAVEQIASSTQSELDQLRSQVRAYQQAATTAAPPKKVVVDDTEPPKKTAHKKKKPVAPGSSSSPSDPSTGKSADGSGAGTSSPKP
jgi:hypothetical protein